MIVLMEITMNNLLAAGALDAHDFLSRVDLLADIGFTVLISNYSEYYRLTSYFRRYTKEMIGVAMGINNLLEIFNEKYYENLEGGILESFGRLFRNSVKLYIYPMRKGGLRDVHRPERDRPEHRRPTRSPRTSSSTQKTSRSSTTWRTFTPISWKTTTSTASWGLTPTS